MNFRQIFKYVKMKCVSIKGFYEILKQTHFKIIFERLNQISKV